MRPQGHENYPSLRLKTANKIGKLVDRSYITEGVILALTSFFYVTKGTDDIRMVFDATLSGLNNSLWDTNSMLPSMGSLVMMVGPETHMINMDVGGGGFITSYFHLCWPSIAEYIWNPIWGIIRTIKEQLSG